MTEGSINAEGYRLVIRHGHPLAGKTGRVLEHRAVLFDEIGPGPHPCRWCGQSLRWVNICVDHLDDDRSNNALANLVPACRRCNSQRTDVLRRRGPHLRALAIPFTKDAVRGVLEGMADMLDSEHWKWSGLSAFELRQLSYFLAVTPEADAECGPL
jgi:hypothetical protein